MLVSIFCLTDWSYSLVFRLFIILDVYMVYHRFMLLQGPNCFLFWWGFFFPTLSPWRAAEYVISLYSVSLVCKCFSAWFLSNSFFCNNILCSQLCIQAMHSSVIDWAGKRTKVCVQLGCWPAGWSWARLFVFMSSALRNIRTLLKNMWCWTTQSINVWLQCLL